MESEIAADLPLDYVKFHILPQDRYEACICNNEKEEMVGDGPLDRLLEHLPNTKGHIAQGSCDNFKLELRGNLDDRAWFTKATFTRFLQLIGSSDLLKKTLAISNEMSQLEETRKFHLSIYGQAEDGIKSSDNSKNELLRAMDSRLASLTEELVSTFNLAAETTLSLQELADLQKFCQHFEDVDMRNMFSKLSEANKKNIARPPMEKKNSPVQFISKDDYVKKTGVNIQASGPSDSNKPIKYDASPAKAAEIERQSLSETESEENSSFSSEDEDDQPSPRRSRTFIRSATPRRSASPMRRIQIGRSGSRRTPALTIKSLTHFPARERVKLEESVEPIKKTEVNVTRMSVQDAISLFERKQNDDTQKKSLVDNNNNNNSTNVNKTVLRRWSSGMGESRNVLAQYIPEDNGNMVNKDGLESNVELPVDCGSEGVEIERTLKVDMESEANEKNGLNQSKDEVAISRVEENNEKMDSDEWSRKKEVELNQMLTKFAESNQINLKNAKPDNTRRNSSLVERGESAIKRVVKPLETKSKPKFQEKPKAEKSHLKVTDVALRNTTTKTQNANKSMPVISNSKKESLKPVIPKKAPPKSSPLPATRKSLPSPRATGILPSKIPTITPPRNTATRQKPQSAASLSKSTPKSERSNLQHKDVKKPLVDSKSRVVSKKEKTVKPTAVVVPKDIPNISPGKPAVLKKVRRSSVVPLEAKPEERKVSGVRPKSKLINRKIAQPEEILSKCEKPIDDSQEKVEVTVCDVVAQLVEGEGDLITRDDHLDEEKKVEREKPESEAENEASVQIDEAAERRSEIEPSEEQVISASAWVESNEKEPSIPNDNRDGDVSSGTRVRHSLSQMLLEESNEPDFIEWGNAENPPTIVYQKDAHKGLKRLMKVALHSKNYGGEGVLSESEPLSARSNASNSSARSSRGPRSFFLSAFRGKKN